MGEMWMMKDAGFFGYVEVNPHKVPIEVFSIEKMCNKFWLITIQQMR